MVHGSPSAPDLLEVETERETERVYFCTVVWYARMMVSHGKWIMVTFAIFPSQVFFKEHNLSTC